jgi:glycosyltransferase involved in cell wall biosynthesis
VSDIAKGCFMNARRTDKVQKEIEAESEGPLVSVIIPSFNQGKFIGESIESVLLQNYRPVEIIIIDACSTDDTLTILHKYDNVPEVKWISEPDKGHADGVNKGFSRAKGEIVAWLNSDDVYYSCDALSIVVEFFSKNPHIDVVYGDVAVISSDSTLLRLFLLPPYHRERIFRGNFICQPAVFMRKNVMEYDKLDINQVGLDYEYWLRLIAKGFRFYHLNKILACDRHYPERISVTQRTLIETQISALKIRLGISQPGTQTRFLHSADRFFQAAYRIKGFLLLLIPLFWTKQQVGFPFKIDSYPKLLWRQLTKAIGSDFKI